MSLIHTSLSTLSLLYVGLSLSHHFLSYYHTSSLPSPSFGVWWGSHRTQHRRHVEPPRTYVPLPLSSNFLVLFCCTTIVVVDASRYGEGYHRRQTSSSPWTAKIGYVGSSLLPLFLSYCCPDSFFVGLSLLLRYSLTERPPPLIPWNCRRRSLAWMARM